MPSSQYLLGVDVGTEGCKALLFNTEGKSLARSYNRYPVIVPEPSWAEQDPLLWWDGVRKSIREVLKKAHVSVENIVCVSLTGQSPVLVAVDGRGKPMMNAIIWMDRRAVEETKRIMEVTGLKEDPSMMLPKIMWVKEHRRNIFRKTHRFLQATDFVGYRLTGKFATDPLTASTIHFDTKKGKWPYETLSKLEIPVEKLPNVLFPTKSAETVSKEASRQTGLREGTPVVLAGIDAYMATVGVNALEPGHVCEITGTSTCIMVPSYQKIRDPETRVVCSPFPLVPDLWITWGIMSSTGASLRWYHDNLSCKESYSELDAEAAEIPPGSDGLIFLPYLMGERSPIWDTSARGVFAGLSLNHTHQHFARAILEGCAFGIRHNLEIIGELGGEINEIWSCGGAAKSRIFGQIKADILGKPIIIPKEIEAPALGSIIIGAVNVGIYKNLTKAAESMVRAKYTIAPQESMHKKYGRFYRMYKDLYLSLKEYFKRYGGDQVGREAKG